MGTLKKMKLNIHEIFRSFQGEGPYTGRKAIFIVSLTKKNRTYSSQKGDITFLSKAIATDYTAQSLFAAEEESAVRIAMVTKISFSGLGAAVPEG